MGPDERGGPEVNFRNEIEILGGLLKVAQRNSWGWEGWTAGEVVWISGRILGTAGGWRGIGKFTGVAFRVVLG